MANSNKTTAPENGAVNDQEIQELKARLAEAEARADEAEQKNAEAEARATEAEQKNAEAEARATEAEQKNAEAEARATEAEQKNAEAEARLAAIKDEEKNAAKKTGMVRIKIPMEKNGPKEDQQVFINGRQYIIKRGVEVDVPRGVAEILRNREKMMRVISEFEAANAQG